jgi:uncharacterized protein
MDLSDQRAKIDYPTLWTYKVIGRDEAGILEAIKDAIGQRDHEVKASKVSSKGRFLSYEVTLSVVNEDDRVGLFHRIQAHSEVKMVL